jgi:hypothetical protein
MPTSNAPKTSHRQSLLNRQPTRSRLEGPSLPPRRDEAVAVAVTRKPGVAVIAPPLAIALAAPFGTSVIAYGMIAATMLTLLGLPGPSIRRNR